MLAFEKEVRESFQRKDERALFHMYFKKKGVVAAGGVVILIFFKH